MISLISSFFVILPFEGNLLSIMAQNIKIKRGLDIPLEGKTSERIEDIKTRSVGLIPDDFEGQTWKCSVKEGDEVAPGTPLLHDKASSLIKIVSPVRGKVKEIRRGERRKILAVVVEVAESSKGRTEYDLSLDSASVRATLQEAGLWAMMRQRPFDIVPDADSQARDIFITAFDSSPLAPALFTKEDIPMIEKGLEVLQVLSGTKPYISVKKGNDYEFKNAETLIIDGPHPAGNVGVQIAAVSPVNKGETVWTMDVTTVIRIGYLYTNGTPSWETKVALTGPEMPDPHLVNTVIGASLNDLLPSSLLSNPDIRVISGNVLTGKKVSSSLEFLRFPYRQVTLLKEGDNADEFMGWASLSPKKYSTKRTFPSFLRGLSNPFPFDSRIKGGKRAMILSGEFDKVFPFDIYPEFLLRAINNGDIDRMEKLGIYEVAPEDFALPEFVDTSKQELQQLVRSALDNLRAEG